MIYTVTFNPALDYVIQIPTLSLGEINRAQQNCLYFGGKGINISRVLKSLGIESTALGFISGFTGSALLDGLNHLGIKSDFILLNDGFTRINIKIKAQKETDINGTGPNINPFALEKLYQKFNTLKSGDYLCLAGSIPPSLPDNIYEAILQSLSGHSIHTIVDATGNLLTNVLKYHPFLIKPNHIELGEIFNKKIETIKDAEFYARKLQEMGAQNVLVSMAEQGALLITKEGDCHTINAPTGTVKNSVGAGDSMIAGFLAGYLSSEKYDYALKLGTAAGCATAFSEDLASKDFIEEILKTL